MSLDNKGNTALEQELAVRFSRLKDQDLERVPPGPTTADLIVLQPAPRRFAWVGSLAAMLLVSLGATFFALRPSQEPVDVYLAIMHQNTVTTDYLLHASPGIFPESDLLPSLYELNFTDGTVQ
ncbi:MAG: hypothetical protein ACJAUG_000094 [Halioglobus sp.]|jgi:hypothetical protein